MNKVMASRIKELRIRKGISQEELAEESGLNLRTIQRIENGETEPVGNSVKKIANVLEVTPEELIDWELEENNSFLKALNISALSFLFFPILGIILPYILWQTKKNRIKGLNQVGRDIVNFQITWNLIYFLGMLIIAVGIILALSFTWWIVIVTASLFSLGMYGINIILIILNTLLIHRGKKLFYEPKFTFVGA